MIFRGIRTSIAKEPYIFCDFPERGAGSSNTLPPFRSAHGHGHAHADNEGSNEMDKRVEKIYKSSWADTLNDRSYQNVME